MSYVVALARKCQLQRMHGRASKEWRLFQCRAKEVQGIERSRDRGVKRGKGKTLGSRNESVRLGAAPNFPIRPAVAAPGGDEAWFF